MRKKAARHLVPIIEERYSLPPDERPNDFLSWLMEDAVGEEKDPHNLTLRVLGVNFAATHSTSLVSRFIRAYIYLTLHFPSRYSSYPCTNSWLSKSCTENYVVPSRILSVQNTYNLSGKKSSLSSESKAGPRRHSPICAN